ncbi:response regulator [Aquipluma nitroreducens]|nr:hypothetical protein [Aquipluma nitroreducens]
MDVKASMPTEPVKVNYCINSNMPQMDGFEMVQQTRESDRKSPILFLSARSSVDDVISRFTLSGNE